MKQFKFDVDDLDACWNKYHNEYLIDILNGDYSVEEAREDLRSLIGTKYDARQNDLALEGKIEALNHKSVDVVGNNSIVPPRDIYNQYLIRNGRENV